MFYGILFNLSDFIGSNESKLYNQKYLYANLYKTFSFGYSNNRWQIMLFLNNQVDIHLFNFTELK